MNSGCLYRFFVTDDAARWRAYWIGLAISCPLGAILFLLGTDKTIASLIGAMVSVIIFGTLAARYSPVKAISNPQALSRREAFIGAKLFASFAATWAENYIFGNVAMAIAFASKAAAEIARDQPISTAKASLYLAVIESHVDSSSGQTKGTLTAAYAQIAAAKIYSAILKRNPQVTSPSEAMDYHGGRAVILRGKDRAIRLDFKGPFGFVGEDPGGMVVENLTITSSYRPPQVPVAVFCRVSSPELAVVVKDCTIQFFRQELSKIVWIGVSFEQCSITVLGSNIVLVNVSFIGCQVEGNASVLDAVPGLRSGNAEHITFATIGTNKTPV